MLPMLHNTQTSSLYTHRVGSDLVVVVKEGEEERSEGGCTKGWLLKIGNHRAIEHLPQCTHIAILWVWVCVCVCGGEGEEREEGVSI